MLVADSCIHIALNNWHRNEGPLHDVVTPSNGSYVFGFSSSYFPIFFSLIGGNNIIEMCLNRKRHGEMINGGLAGLTF